MDQIKTLRKSGISVTIFKFSPKKNPLNYIKTRMKLKKLYSKKFDLIHAHCERLAYFKISGIPLITTFP